MLGAGRYPPIANAAVCVPVPAKLLLEVTRRPPLAQVPTVAFPAVVPFKALVVLLYQTCPRTGFAGSVDTASMFVPFISLYVH